MKMLEYYNPQTKKLCLPSLFTKKLYNVLEETEIIVFSKNSFFRKSIDNLPKNLSQLIFGYWFNQPVKNLPKNLTYLSFGFCFNQSLNKLPKNLKYLKLDYNFNSLSVFSKNLNILSLTCNNKLINNIPNNIEKLYITFYDDEYYNYYIENLPSTVLQIIIEDIKFKKYLKIPFSCILTIQKIEK